MSRVDDERQAQRAVERQAETRRNEELQRTKKAGDQAAFKKLVGQQQGQAQAAQQRTHEKKGELGKNAIASLLEAAEAQTAEAQTGRDSRAAREGQHAFGQKLGKHAASDRQAATTRADGQHHAAVGEGARETDQQGAKLVSTEKHDTARGLDERKADARLSREALSERHEATESANGASVSGGGAMGEKGDLKADADKGGQGGQGQQKDGKDNAPAQPGFRFNPALMAPVPVAKPKEASGSERLRQVANELAQKIVERVRVGTNAAGKVEFQIDLRSDVLKGLSVRVSSHQGRIKAVFQGSDREVLKLIQDQREALTAALGARGLKLEDFTVEARA